MTSPQRNDLQVRIAIDLRQRRIEGNLESFRSGTNPVSKGELCPHRNGLLFQSAVALFVVAGALLQARVADVAQRD
jgi:hypothetical protein